MRFSLPTNWDDALIPALKASDPRGDIDEVYGKLEFDLVGGGRPASTLSAVSRRGAQRHIALAHGAGIRFNYLLNGLCLDNREVTPAFQRRLHALCGWVRRAGADSVTVSNPYLCAWVRRNYPELVVYASAHACVDSPLKARFWEDMGAAKITLANAMVNRDLPLIKRIRSAVSCRLQLIANSACVPDCPTYINHALSCCHASQKGHGSKGYTLDYYFAMCRLARLRDPVNFIRCDWIRPEDTGFYAEMGIDSIKLIDRRLSADRIAAIAGAYLRGSYEGNLVDLFPSLEGRSFHTNKSPWRKILFLKNLLFLNPFKIVSFSRLLGPVQAVIDNTKLDGFIRNIPASCDRTGCARCGYCASFAAKAVHIDETYRAAALREFEEKLDDVFTRGLCSRKRQDKDIHHRASAGA